MLYASYWQWTEWIQTTNEHDLLRLLMQQHIMDYLYTVLYINQLNYLEKKSVEFFGSRGCKLWATFIVYLFVRNFDVKYLRN